MKDLTNQQFGKLIALRSDGKNNNGQYFWISKCECGLEHRCLGTSLLRGDTNRCTDCTKSKWLEQNHARSTKVGHITSAWWSTHVIKRANGHNSSKHLRVEKKTYKVNITMEYIWDLYLQQKGLCALSGLPLDFPEGRKVYGGTASLDRIDSTKGYIKENVQWLHKEINMLKGSRTDEQLIAICKLITENNRIK
jgi:hypothetical protein